MRKKNQPKNPQPIIGNLGGPIIGPTNPRRDAENPDMLVPPPHRSWPDSKSEMVFF